MRYLRGPTMELLIVVATVCLICGACVLIGYHWRVCP